MTNVKLRIIQRTIFKIQFIDAAKKQHQKIQLVILLKKFLTTLLLVPPIFTKKLEIILIINFLKINKYIIKTT